MRIAIDARELSGKRTGVGRYLSEILAAWGQIAAAAAHEFVLCAPQPVAIEPGGTLRIAQAILPGRGVVWEQRVLPRLVDGADVLFAPGYTGPLLSRVPMVMTIHDVSFAAHPEWFSWHEGLRRRVVTRLAARRALKIITVSGFSKREIVRRLGVPSSKVEVIYSGGSDIVAPGPAARRDPLVLYVGSLFNRRNIPAMIDGFARLAERLPDVRLELVGDNRTRPWIDVDELIARSPAASRMRARAYVSDAELAALYSTASAFVFLSEYEGFALTPLEALRAGVPVVLLDTEVAREIYGPAAVYVGRPDPDAVATALERLLVDEDERRRLREAASLQLRRYSWAECAQRTLQVILACTR